jgi:hypothetical protein
MITLLRRKGRSALAVERAALPAATTSTEIGADMSNGPYSLRLFGIGADGPLLRGAVDGIAAKKSPARPAPAPRRKNGNQAATGKQTQPTNARSQSKKKKKSKRPASTAAVKSAMRNSASSSGSRPRASFWRGR